jgi:N-methylhydantoinase A
VLHITLSHGGLATRQTAERFPVRLVESGPAGGAMVAAFHAARLTPPAGTTGAGDALAFDMGGTTAKVCLLERGVPRLTHRLEVARVHRLKRGSGLPLSVPCVDLIEIGAGGGSIVHLDRLGLLQVGPQSAGADPGPACYGRGGTAPTVTDADLVLGYLDPQRFLGGALPLDAGAAHAAFQEAIARPLGTDVLAAASATQLAVDEAMAGAARVHAAERGCDLRRVDLIAFGGAGPVHADRVARALKVRRLIIPYGAGTASGLGFLVAPLAFDLARSAPQAIDTIDPDTVAALCRRLADEGRALVVEAGLAPEAVIEEWSADMRYAGQGYEIGVPCDTPPWRLDAAGLRARFETVYRAAYGRVHPAAPVEVVTWRLRARGPRPQVEPRYETVAGAGRPAPATRLAYAPERGGLTPFAVYDRRELTPGASIVGPAIVAEQASTAVLGVGATATVDTRLNLLITFSGRALS